MGLRRCVVLGVVFGAALGCGGSAPPTPVAVIPPPKAEIAAPLEDDLPYEGSRGEPGALDTSFGRVGTLVLRHGPGEHRIHDLALLPGGAIGAVGYAPFGGGQDITAVRLSPDGALDTHFGAEGFLRVGELQGFGSVISALADGTTYVAGYHYAKNAAEDLILARVLPDGTLDATFGYGGTGIVTRDFGSSDDRPSAVLPTPEGGVIVVGIHGHITSPMRPTSGRFGNDYEIYLARFDARGRIDPSFGKSGVSFVDATPTREFATRAEMMRDGRIVIGGYVPLETAVFVSRILPDGSFDTSFGDRGTVLLSDVEMQAAWALVVAPDGGVLLGGQLEKGPAAIVRLLPDGRRDLAWGRAGVASGPSGSEDQLYSLVIEPSGKVVGVGFRGLASDAVFFLGRWDERGVLDPSFGIRGSTTTRLSKEGDFAFTAARDRYGRLVVGGQSATAFAFARYFL